jgi:DNA-directed RNA polymerase specialized sigma subunit
MSDEFLRDSDRINNLLDNVASRERATREFLRKLGSGQVDKTILQLAKFLHISARKAKEYFMKEWADNNLALKSGGNCWDWDGAAEDLEDMPEQTETLADYVKRKKLKELQQKLRTLAETEEDEEE